MQIKSIKHPIEKKEYRGDMGAQENGYMSGFNKCLYEFEALDIVTSEEELGAAIYEEEWRKDWKHASSSDREYFIEQAKGIILKMHKIISLRRAE